MGEGDSDNEATKLGRLLSLAGEDDPDGWLPGDLAEIWKHQLAAPLEIELKETSGTLTEHDRQRAAPRTFGDLLRDESPPMELLKLVKTLAKKRRASGVFPAEIAAAIYYSTIAAAMSRHQARISELDDAALKARI